MINTSSKNNKHEGFWHSSQEPNYPRPVHSDASFPNKDLVLKKLSALQARLPMTQYRGFSTCRCCRTSNGSGEFKYKGWVWPEGFIHYIVEHNVEPSPDFQKHVLKMV